MTKNVEVTIDIEIARRMLKVAGVMFVNDMTDDEVFEEALKMNEEYVVESTVITLPDMREKVKEYIAELDTEIDRCHKLAEQNIEDDSTTLAEMMLTRVHTLTEVKNDLQGRLDELI